MRERLCRWLYRHRCKGLACLVDAATFGRLLAADCTDGCKLETIRDNE